MQAAHGEMTQRGRIAKAMLKMEPPCTNGVSMATGVRIFVGDEEEACVEAADADPMC